MVKLIGFLSLISSKKILVVGDVMLDRYTIGKTSRISPEAPVPVLHVKEEKSLPGGAGNVALNLISLNQEVVLLGRCGSDKAGEELRHSLASEGINISGLIVDQNYPTPVKNRIIADNQQMLRIDHEEIIALSAECEAKILIQLPSLLESVNVIAISDYGKGFLSRSLLKVLIEEANKRDIRIIVDPKGADFTKYKHATIIKPNLKEAYAASHLALDTPLNEVASSLLAVSEIDSLMITRSEEGISVFNKDSRRDFPVKAKKVKDVTGAGDTVLATLATALASGMTLDQSAELCNVAASLAVEQVGCARITLQDMSKRLLDDHAEHKVINSHYAPALHYALKDRPHTILELPDGSNLDPELFSQIQSLKATSTHTLVMSVPASIKNRSLIPMLTSLKEVDFVIEH